MFINSGGVAEASLVKVLIKLEELRVLTVGPIVLLDQVTAVRRMTHMV